jgi:hypothetical protein
MSSHRLRIITKALPACVLSAHTVFRRGARYPKGSARTALTHRFEADSGPASGTDARSARPRPRHRLTASPAGSRTRAQRARIHPAAPGRALSRSVCTPWCVPICGSVPSTLSPRNRPPTPPSVPSTVIQTGSRSSIRSWASYPPSRTLVRAGRSPASCPVLFSVCRSASGLVITGLPLLGPSEPLSAGLAPSVTKTTPMR